MKLNNQIMRVINKNTFYFLNMTFNHNLYLIIKIYKTIQFYELFSKKL